MSALACVHLAPQPDGSTVATTWHDTRSAAQEQCERHRAGGADLARIFRQPKSALGPWRAVGYFPRSA